MFRLPGTEPDEVDQGSEGDPAAPRRSRLLARPGRLPALLVALAVIPAALIALFAWTQTTRLVERGVGEDLSSTASSRAIFTESVLENVTKEASSVATERTSSSGPSRGSAANSKLCSTRPSVRRRPVKPSSSPAA
jgi:hypothetical protein